MKCAFYGYKDPTYVDEGGAFDTEICHYVKRLYEWVIENGLQDDPERISKLYDEVRRRWPQLITRHVSEIVEGTLRKMKK